MTTTVKSLALAAAFAGLIGGTSVRLNAQTAQSNGSSVQSTHVGILLVQDTTQPKHACKGQNDCKGQGGCKTGEQGCKGKNDCKGKGGCKAGDNGCKAKNSCKGKGGCATDGSKPPANS